MKDYYMCLEYCHVDPNDMDKMVLPGCIGNTSQFQDVVRFITNKGTTVAMRASFISTSKDFMGLDINDAVRAINILKEKGCSEEWFKERGMGLDYE